MYFKMLCDLISVTDVEEMVIWRWRRRQRRCMRQPWKVVGLGCKPAVIWILFIQLSPPLTHTHTCSLEALYLSCLLFPISIHGWLLFLALVLFSVLFDMRINGIQFCVENLCDSTHIFRTCHSFTRAQYMYDRALLLLCLSLNTIHMWKFCL